MCVFLVAYRPCNRLILSQGQFRGTDAHVSKMRSLFVGWLLNVPATCDDFTCCHTEIKIADQTFYLTQSQYTDTGPTNSSADRIMPGAWQGSQFLSHWYDSTPKKFRRKRNSNPGSSAFEADALTTRPTKRLSKMRRRRSSSNDRNNSSYNNHHYHHHLLHHNHDNHNY